MRLVALSVLFLTGACAQTGATSSTATGAEAAPAAAVSETSAPAQMADASSTDPNRTVCKAITATGSRLGKTRVCKTKAEWDAQTRAAQEETQRNQVDRGPTPQ